MTCKDCSRLHGALESQTINSFRIQSQIDIARLLRGDTSTLEAAHHNCMSNRSALRQLIAMHEREAGHYQAMATGGGL